MEEPLDQDASPSTVGKFPKDGELNSTTLVGLDERILDITSRHTINVLRTPPTKKAKRVRFFRNGDKYYTGVVMAVTPERYRSFDSLASDLTRALVSNVTLPNGVRTIYTMNGRKVQSVSDLEDGKCYVVSGQGEMFKKVEYSSSKVRRGSSLSGLPQSPASTGRQISVIPLCVKARIVTLIRHGTKPRKVLRLLLNKRNAPSLEHAMEAITEAVKLDTGAVRKVYTLSGHHITSLEQFFESDDIFLAYGPEKSVQEDFELDFEETKYVQSFRRCPWSSKRQSGPMPRMPRKSGKKTLTTPQVRTPSPSTLILPQPLRLHYTVGHVIGDGNFAVVRHCIHKSTGVEYAIKIVDKYKCQGKETMLASEVAILRQVCHPNIISLIAEQETTDQLFLVMELVKGGDLFDAIAAATKFSEAEASVMISHLTSALAYLHSHHIVHRDVKPENLLVEMDGSHVRCLKLGDFGLAQVVREPLYTVCGTPTYVAPEILAEAGYGLKIDVWAAGVILYILLCGFPPFVSPENEQEELFERILSGQYEFTSPYWDTVSDSAKQLITNMLQAQPELRFSAEDVLDHPWLASFLGGEQTTASASTDTAKQHRDQQCKPIRLATFEFDFKKQRNRQDSLCEKIDAMNDDRTSLRVKWKDDTFLKVDDARLISIQQGQKEEHRSEVDFANGNPYKNESPVLLHPDCNKDNLSQSMHDLINNLNENRTPRRCLKSSQSATSSLNSIPENLSSSPLNNSKLITCNYHSSSSIHYNEVDEKNSTITKSHGGDKNNGNSVKGSKCPSVYSNCETPKPSRLPVNRQKHNRRNLYGINGINVKLKFDSDDFRNSNATASSSTDSLTGSSMDNDIETSDSFVNIQFARLAHDQKSSSTQSMESTDSFENVSFKYTGDINAHNPKENNYRSDCPQATSKINTLRNKDKSVTRVLETQIAALSVSDSTKLDKKSERKGYNTVKVQETNKCMKNEIVKLRHERYINRKSQNDSKNATKTKRYSCFSQCVPKRSPEEISDRSKVTRKFSSTDELHDEKQKPIAKSKRFSLYYTPQPLRKTYENEIKTGKVGCKLVNRMRPSEMNKSKNEETKRVERIDKSRKSLADASTAASKSKSSRQNVHVRASLVNTSLTSDRTK